ncbi:HPr family phosphocarrier protein [Zavarzinia compransoris]|uniref:HPr family phosphocarrier protein n=1 Tax=Zavarzinia marina TaxID=2911065 RepID=UPI001F15C965|nr:HPr family phosphocarrier protein [Zavarzinia marina]MCF4166186.1 HPr family phosphocarrier protein [Zavarzinia marina]
MSIAEDDPTAPTRQLKICNRRGLHARAAAKFVTTASRFDAEVLVTKDGAVVTGTSIMGLMMLAAAKGTTIDVSATGPEAEAALTALAELVDNRFNEDE